MERANSGNGLAASAPPVNSQMLVALAERGTSPAQVIGGLHVLYGTCGVHSTVQYVRNKCNAIEESSAQRTLSALVSIAGKLNFRPSRHVIELRGVCAAHTFEEGS